MLEPATADPLPETLEAIANADLITLGPGSLYTSLITNLLVRGMPEALAASKATKVFVCNLMTQANESLGLIGFAAYREDPAACGWREVADLRLCADQHRAYLGGAAGSVCARGPGAD